MAVGALVAVLALTAGVQAWERSGLFLNGPSLEGRRVAPTEASSEREVIAGWWLEYYGGRG